MKQGEARRLKPKPKKDKKSWQKRNEARKDKQEQFQKDLELIVNSPITKLAIND